MSHPIKQSIRQLLSVTGLKRPLQSFLSAVGLRKRGQRWEDTYENTPENNRMLWGEHDWSRLGEEWSNNPEWKSVVVSEILQKNVPENSSILEIGPGGGRWTEHLVARASRLALVDVTPKCLDLCKDRFRDYNIIGYHLNDGRDLSFIADSSIDRIWSFDVLVHVAASDIGSYVSQFARILRPGGMAILHHAAKPKPGFGWRSDMSAEKMQEFCNNNHLELIGQFNSLYDNQWRIWPTLSADEQPDVVSILKAL